MDPWTGAVLVKLTEIIIFIDSAQLETDGAASLKIVVTDSKTS